MNRPTGISLLMGAMAWSIVAEATGSGPSDLDLTFGNRGMVALAFSGQGDAVAALQPDGKLLLANNTTQATPGATRPTKLSWLIHRFTVEGRQDLAFGTNGTVTVSFDVNLEGTLGDDYPNGIALLPDGRFVVAGRSIGPCGAGAGCLEMQIMARFSANGALDTAFGSNGKVIGPSFGADSLAIQADGKIVTQTNRSFLLAAYSPQLERFNADGSLDSSFAPNIPCIGNGKFRLSSEGKIVVITTYTPTSPASVGFCIYQLNADGTPDTTFGTGGQTVIAVATGILRDFFFDTSGRIVLAVLAASDSLLRLNPDGTLDTTFGVGGLASIGAVLPVTAVAGDCWNRTIVAGLPNPDAGATYFLLGRFLEDGSIDGSFTTAAGDFAQTNLAAPVQLLVRPNGHILALTINVPTNSELIVQYQGDLPCATTPAVEYYYAAWNHYFVTAFPAEIAALDGGAFGGAWQRTGQTFDVWPQPNVSASPTCRFFSTSFAPKSSHFYTPFPAECAAVKSNPGWQFESIAFYIQIPTGYGTGNGSCPPGTVALYRAYNDGMGGAPNHRYTTSLAVLNTMLAQGWVFEGEANTKIFACVPG